MEWTLGTFSLSRRVSVEHSVEQTPAWWIHQYRHSLRIDEYGNRDEQFPEVRNALKALGSEPHSFLGVALTACHGRLGAFAIAISWPRAYSENGPLSSAASLSAPNSGQLAG